MPWAEIAPTVRARRGTSAAERAATPEQRPNAPVGRTARRSSRSTARMGQSLKRLRRALAGLDVVQPTSRHFGPNSWGSRTTAKKLTASPPGANGVVQEVGGPAPIQRIGSPADRAAKAAGSTGQRFPGRPAGPPEKTRRPRRPPGKRSDATKPSVRQSAADDGRSGLRPCSPISGR